MQFTQEQIKQIWKIVQESIYTWSQVIPYHHR